MDFVRYAERSAALVNAALPDAAAVVDHLADRPWLQPQVTDRDAAALRRLQRELRPVFDAGATGAAGAAGDSGGSAGSAAAGSAEEVVALVNALLAKHPVTPYISGHDTRGGSPRWHLHVADRDSTVAELLTGEALLGLAMLVCDLGPTRLGVCSGEPCEDVFVDTSPNHSRRYCSDRCSSRANVAAYRARQRARQDARAHPTTPAPQDPAVKVNA
jgi:hypothetical protein